MKELHGLKEIQEALTGRTIVEVSPGPHGKVASGDSYTEGWRVINRLDDGSAFVIDWSGYEAGYSEYTPSGHGYISFYLYDRGELI